jgi:hypothetical protein
MTTTIIANPSEFHGYPVDLLAGLKGLGKSIIGDDTLFAAVEAYNAASVTSEAGSTLGPALLTADCTITVTSSTAHAVPEHVARPVVAPVVEAETEGWDGYTLDDLLAKVAEHGVEVKGRVKTPGKLIAALEAADVKP